MWAVKDRSSNQGDLVAMHLFEDLHAIDRSDRYQERVESGRSVLNTLNTRHGIKARRGDGTFGESVPGEEPIHLSGFVVGRGPTATIEIGVEVKILAKAMIKQIDRVVKLESNQRDSFHLPPQSSESLSLPVNSSPSSRIRQKSTSGRASSNVVYSFARSLSE